VPAASGRERRDRARVALRVCVPGRGGLVEARGTTRVTTSAFEQTGRETVKIRVFRWLAVVGLAGVFATTALAAGNAHTQRTAAIKIGVSLAGYSTDFWSSYVAFEKAAGKKYSVSLVGPIS